MEATSQPSISISHSNEPEAPVVEKVQDLSEEIVLEQDADATSSKQLFDLKTAQKDFVKRLEGKVPLKIQATWQKGQVSCPELNLTCSLPPKLTYSAEAKPCRSFYAPLILAAASFCQKFYEQAKIEEIQVESIKATASSEVNANAFYRRIHDWDSRDPWKTIDLDVNVQTDASQEELEAIAAHVMESESPTKELLEEHFCVEVNLEVDEVEETTPVFSIENFCNVSEYKRIGEGDDTNILQKQSVSCTLEQGVLQIETDNGISFPLSTAETVPLGKTSDGNPTPVQAFLFDCLALYMQTFILRMASRGHALHSLTGTFSTIMNNGVKDYDDGLEPSVFSVLGGEISLQVKSDADNTSVDNAFQEAQDMAPTYLALSGAIEIDLAITKTD